MNDAQDRANRLVNAFYDIINSFRLLATDLPLALESIIKQLEEEILLGQERGERIFENAIKIQALEDLARQDTTPPPPAAESAQDVLNSYYDNSPASILITRLKEAAAITPTLLAVICGVHVSSITNWSNNKPIREINYNRLIEICHAFHLPTKGDTP